ncbi:hypothetical protein [Rhodopirellula sp. SWK7]|uniref:hypothetical protein n=1 Tax=Rhodopirellula sp. SWK7 TaxID=595460 RepID=UPI0005C4EAA3|nr:hypothetical protein [Rhodopirellula sp. SWK7]
MSSQAFSELTSIAGMATFVWLIARLLHFVIGRSNERKRIHGLYIPEWIAGTIILSGVAALAYFGPANDVPAPPSAGCAAFGLLGGLLFGNVHGWIRLDRHTKTSKKVAIGRVRETGNPYEPPSPIPNDGG